MTRDKKPTTLIAYLMCFLLSNVACNGRPTFDIEVLDFESDCGEPIALRLEYDPEPEICTIKVEPEDEEKARAAGLSFSVKDEAVYAQYKSGILCRFPRSVGTANCYRVATSAPEQCIAKTRLYAYRYPSKGPGYMPPFAKKGEQYYPPDSPGRPGT